MPSKNMLPKGQRRHSVKAEYRATRGVETAAAPAVPTLELDPYGPGADQATHTAMVPAEATGLRLDQYLAQAIPEISRSRVQLLIDHGQVLVNGAAAKAKHKISPGETITIHGSPRPAPLQAQAEAIPLTIIFEDDFLAIVDKPAGMNVHAGAAAPEAQEDEAAEETGENSAEEVEPVAAPRRDPRSSGTLVNALLHHFAGKLSTVGGELRPGIVHRLDKQTSGLLLVAKDDRTHSKLAEAFAERTVDKTYLALVHGRLRPRPGARPDDFTVSLPIGRDLVRRTRMTTRRPLEAQGVRHAVSHVHVLERLETPFGAFSLVEVTIETGRTHQIRVHLQALGHVVVGDTLYGAPAILRAGTRTLGLERNFLHAARLSLAHPRTGKPLQAEASLPAELTEFLELLRRPAPESPESR